MLNGPLVGREAELPRLLRAIEPPEATGLFIVGDAGVGKTRLAAELAGRLKPTGRAVTWATASPSARAIPYAPIAHLVTPALAEADADQPRLLARLVQDLRNRWTDAGPFVVVVDDAQHLDDHSATLVHQAIQQRAASVVLTARSGEGVPSALTQLWKDGLAERVEIKALGRQAAHGFSEAVLEGPVESPLVEQLWRRSTGNPLFLRELILGGIESRTIVHADGLWRATGSMRPSERLTELVLERLGRLKASQPLVVEALAVGDSVDLSVLELMGVADELEELEERRLVVVEQRGNRSAARLAHPLYGEVILARMPRSRVRRVTRALADGLEATGARRSDDVLRVALWRLDGGGTADADQLLEAARIALSTFDAELAERLARAATGLVDSAAANLLLGQAFAAQQRVDEAADSLERAATQADSDEEIARTALARADLLYFRAGRFADAAEILDEAIDRVADEGWLDELEALRALFRASASDLEGVADSGARMMDRRGAQPRAAVHTLMYSSIANIMLGRFAEADEQLAMGLRLAPVVRSELPLGGQMLSINRVMRSAYAGLLDKALLLSDEGYRASLNPGANEVVAMWSLNLAECQLLAGNPAEALRLLFGTLSVVRDTDPFAVHAIAASVASVCASWLDRDDLAAELRQDVLDREQALDVRSRIWLERATTWTTLAESNSQTAARQAVDAGHTALANSHRVWAAWSFHDAVRLGHPDEAVSQLDALADGIEGALVPAMAQHGRALADDDPVKLERTASAFEQLGSRLFAAEAAAQAQQSYLRRGRRRLARIAGARASMLAARHPEVRTPALVASPPVPLTRRQVEIAALAAAGHPSREIAERLGISVRTVDNHLGEIYGKLGISGRADLASAMGVMGGVPDEAS